MSSSPNLIVHHLQNGQGERIPWLLEELAIPYTLKTYQRSPLLSPPELKAVYPLGASPVLEDLSDPSHPVKIAESGAIAEYILHKYGQGKLLVAPTAPNFADYLYWFHFANGTLQPGLFRRAMARGAGTDSPRFKQADARTRGLIEHLDKRLVASTWLAGEEFSAADVMIGWCFGNGRRWEPVDLNEYAGIARWLKACGEREAYRVAAGKADPQLSLEENLSLEGPPVNELFKQAMGAKP